MRKVNILLPLKMRFDSHFAPARNGLSSAMHIVRRAASPAIGIAQSVATTPKGPGFEPHSARPPLVNDDTDPLIPHSHSHKQ